MSWKTNLLRQSATNRILPIEIWGRTLVVIPKGDASGFSETEFAHEKQLLEKFVQEPQVEHVIVDLKSSEYFGSDVTAVVIALAEQCRQSGKTCGLANVSGAMRVSLRDLHNNSACEWYDTRRQAERDLVKLTGGERTQRLFRRRDFRLFLMLVAVCLFGWWLTSLRTRQSELLSHTDALEKILRNHRSMRDLGHFDNDWNETVEGYRRDLEMILTDIEGDKSEAAAELRAAIEHNMLPLLREPWSGTTEQMTWDRNAAAHLSESRRLIAPPHEDAVDD